MSNIKLITVCSHPEHAMGLINSAKKHGWDIVVIQCEWRGFGTKLIETYNYLKAHPEVERFIFADAFDVVVLGTPDEFDLKLPANDGFVFNAERGLWPPNMEQYRELFGITNGGFNFINSGVYYAERNAFISLIESNPIEYHSDDQQYFIEIYANKFYGVILDVNQRVFNCHSFIRDGEYTYNNGRVQIMDSEPIFIHSNGKTVDEKLNQMLEI